MLPSHITSFSNFASVFLPKIDWAVYPSLIVILPWSPDGGAKLQEAVFQGLHHSLLWSESTMRLTRVISWKLLCSAVQSSWHSLSPRHCYTERDLRSCYDDDDDTLWFFGKSNFLFKQALTVGWKSDFKHHLIVKRNWNSIRAGPIFHSNELFSLVSFNMTENSLGMALSLNYGLYGRA